MGPVAAGPTRREQRRAQTVREIRALAMQQIAEDGPDAVSLNAIARTMGMSPAAIYRYFDNRNALLADLVVTFYDSLADTMEAAGKDRTEPVGRFTAVAQAYRRWALDHPNDYRLIFQTTSGSGQDLAPERTISAATRSMTAILAALAALPGADGDCRPQSPAGSDPDLDEQLMAWVTRTQQPALSVRILALGLACWTRFHGIISLELGHHLASTGIDPALLYDAEIRALVHRAGTA